jgi:threonine aldolase
LLALENTFGGKLLPMNYVQQATELARSKGLTRHLDGARLFNAAVAQAGLLGTDCFAEARRIAQCFDSVSVCFSKGLGAPAGSALCGSRELLARAHRIRKMAGGGMRQAGLLAAAASYALDHHVERLAQDHALALRLAEGLSGMAGLVVEPAQSNMVFVELVGQARARATELLPFLAARGVLASGLYRLRFVTHLDVDAAGIEHTLIAMRDFLAV